MIDLPQDPRTMVLSPNGVHAVSWNQYHLMLWDLTTGTVAAEQVLGHAHTIYFGSFSPDGSRFAAAYSPGAMLIWNFAAEALFVTASPLNTTSLSWSPDGIRLFCVATDRQVTVLRMWDGTSGLYLGEITRTRPFRRGPFRAGKIGVYFSPDGKRFVTTDTTQARGVKLWDVSNTSALIPPLPTSTEPATIIAFSPDGSRLVSAYPDNTLRIWDTSRGVPIGEPLHGNSGKISALSFSPDGSQILSISACNGVLHAWNAETGTLIGIPLIHDISDASLIVFVPSRIVLIALRRLLVCDAAGHRLFAAPRPTFDQWAVSPDGNFIVGGERSRMRLYDGRSGVTLDDEIQLSAPLQTDVLPPYNILLFVFSTDSKLIKIVTRCTTYDSSGYDRTLVAIYWNVTSATIA
jgi:WD40 repeat protein